MTLSTAVLAKLRKADFIHIWSRTHSCSPVGHSKQYVRVCFQRAALAEVTGSIPERTHFSTTDPLLEHTANANASTAMIAFPIAPP